MPYKRSFRSNRFGSLFGKRHGFRRISKRRFSSGLRFRRSSKVGIAYRGWSTMKGVLKYYDIPFNSSSVTSTTPYYLPLHAAATGSGVNQISAQKMFMKTLSLKITLNTDPASTVANTVARVLVVMDRQANLNSVVGTSKLTEVLVQNNVTSMINLDNRERYYVFLDRTLDFTQNAGGAAAAGGTFAQRHIVKNIRINKPCLMKNAANTANTTDMQTTLTNGLFLLIFTNNANASSIQLAGTSRLRFRDS